MHRHEAIYTHPDQLTDEYKEQLWKFLSIQICIEGGMGDAKGIPPHNAMTAHEFPETRHRRFIANKLADERDHAYGLFQVAKGIGKDPHALLAAVREDPEKTRALDAMKELERIGTHLEFEVLCLLGEAAGGIASLGMVGGTYLPWSMWNARNFLDEGLTHSLLSMRQCREAVDAGDGEIAQAHYDHHYPFWLDAFGAANTPNEEAYLRLGIKTLTNTECRVIWLRQMRDRTEKAGLKFPQDPYQGKRGRYDECEEGLEGNWGAFSDQVITDGQIYGQGVLARGV